VRCTDAITRCFARFAVRGTYCERIEQGGISTFGAGKIPMSWRLRDRFIFWASPARRRHNAELRHIPTFVVSFSAAQRSVAGRLSPGHADMQVVQAKRGLRHPYLGHGSWNRLARRSPDDCGDGGRFVRAGQAPCQDDGYRHEDGTDE
jgi:hypothetical protein